MSEDTINLESENLASGGDNTGTSSSFRAGYVGLLASGHLSVELYASFLAPLLPLLIPKLGLSIAMVGLLATMQSLANSLLQPVFGHLADRGHSRLFVPLGLAVTAIFFSLIGLATHYYVLVLLVVLGGLGVAFFHPPCAVLIGDASRQRRGLGMSFFVAAGSLGSAIGPVLIVSAVSLFTLEGSYLIVVPGLLFAAVLYFLAPHKVTSQEHPQVAQHTGSANGSNALPIAIVVTIVILQASTALTFGTFVPTYLEANGFSLFTSGAALSIYNLCGAAGGLLVGYLSFRVRPARILQFSLIVSAPLFFLFLHTDGPAKLVLLGAGGLLIFGVNPLALAMGQELAPRRASMVSGLIMGFAWGIASMFLTDLGVAADRVGLPTAMTIMTAVPLLAAVLTLALPNTSRRGAVQQSVRP
ncbi:MAG: MFS transporter [Chloroflexi bacterium]|nr:MFS transporter [Chloroflexota bacterium]